MTIQYPQASRESLQRPKAAAPRRFFLRVAPALGIAVGCAVPTPSSSMSPDTRCAIPEGLRAIAEVDLGVGKSEGGGCEGVGGNLFNVTPGSLTAIATWSDPAALLKAEIWTEGFGRVLAAGQPVPGQLCTPVSGPVEVTRVVIRVCHTPQSRVPVAVRTDARTFTQYRLVVAQ